MNNDPQSGADSTAKHGDKIRMELHAVIRRWAQESDVTLYQVLGALRVVEHDLILMLDQQMKPKGKR